MSCSGWSAEPNGSIAPVRARPCSAGARVLLRRVIGRIAVLMSLASFVIAVVVAAPHAVAHHDAAPTECALCVLAAGRPGLTSPAPGPAVPVLSACEHTPRLGLTVRAGVPACVTGRGPPAPAFVSE